MNEPMDLAGVVEEVRFHHDGMATAVFRDSLGRRFKILLDPRQLQPPRPPNPFAALTDDE